MGIISGGGSQGIQGYNQIGPNGHRLINPKNNKRSNSVDKGNAIIN